MRLVGFSTREPFFLLRLSRKSASGEQDAEALGKVFGLFLSFERFVLLCFCLCPRFRGLQRETYLKPPKLEMSPAVTQKFRVILAGPGACWCAFSPWEMRNGCRPQVILRPVLRCQALPAEEFAWRLLCCARC